MFWNASDASPGLVGSCNTNPFLGETWSLNDLFGCSLRSQDSAVLAQDDLLFPFILSYSLVAKSFVPERRIPLSPVIVNFLRGFHS